MHPSADRIPMLIIAGFLGAGRTTPTLHKTRIPEGYEPCAVFIGHGLTEKTIRATLETPAAIPEFKLR